MARAFTTVLVASMVVGICMATAIDNPQCFAQFQLLRKTDPSDPRLYHERYPNQTIIESIRTTFTLAACNEACGRTPVNYPFWDVQKRFTTWILPLFVLIGSIHFVPLGKWNGLQVVVHVLGDPIHSLRCLLSKLATYQRWHRRGRSCTTLAPETRKDLARIMLAYDAWHGVLSCSQGYHLTPTAEEMMTQMTTWLQDGPHLPETRRIARLHACRGAANQLSDCRVAGFSKSLIGTVNFVMIMIMSLIHINKGEFNNRTGHSIAFGMLYSWVIPTALLSSMVGGFVSKHSSQGILARLQMDLIRIELDSNDPMRAAAVPHISPFSQIPTASTAAIYRSLPWCGGNYLYAPRRRHPFGRSSAAAIQAAALFPTLLAVCSGVFISYTSPTRGLGCRSVMQIVCFYLPWLISTGLTHLIQATSNKNNNNNINTTSSPPTETSLYVNEPLVPKTTQSCCRKPSYPPFVTLTPLPTQDYTQDYPNPNTNPLPSFFLPPSPSLSLSHKTQYRLILLKDLCIFTPQLIFLLASYSGVLNNCFCWSAWFSRRGAAHIVAEPRDLIMALARHEWPVFSLAAVLLHLGFVLGVWIVWRGGAGLFGEGEEEEGEGVR